MNVESYAIENILQHPLARFFYGIFWFSMGLVWWNMNFQTMMPPLIKLFITGANLLIGFCLMSMYYDDVKCIVKRQIMQNKKPNPKKEYAE